MFPKRETKANIIVPALLILSFLFLWGLPLVSGGNSYNVDFNDDSSGGGL